MRTILSFAALFVSALLMQLGSGSLGPLDALSGIALGFSSGQIGLMGSAHFAGFFLGCWLAPRYIGTVGHARAFAATAGIGIIGPLLHPVLQDPYAWAALRLLTGLAIAAGYTVIESWMQAKVTNEHRGRVFGFVRVVDMGGQVAAQAMIAVLEPASYVAYNIVAVICCLCLLPISLTRAVPPPVTAPPRLRPLAALRLSPSAVFGIVVAGMTSAAFRMVGPVVAVDYRLDQRQIAVFLAASVIGGAAAQYPVGWIADKFDRRKVLIALSALAFACCLWTVSAIGPGEVGALYLAALLFGLTTLPVYSVAAAYANDFAPRDFIVDLNAALLFYFSLGAIVSPLAVSWLIEVWGSPAMFVYVGVAHLALIGFALYRMTRRRAPRPSAPYRYLPRTTMIVARLLNRAEAGPANGGRPIDDRPPDAPPDRKSPRTDGRPLDRP